jgi:hypothetical protein
MSRSPADVVLRSYTIEDDLARAHEAAVEVTVTLADERRRWCFFMTPAALAACGDVVEGTRVRLHLGEPHMIVVSELTPDVIERVLRELEAAGELVRRTLPLDRTRNAQRGAAG